MVYFTFGMFFYGPPSSRSKPMIQQSSPVVAHLGRSDLAVACSDAGDDDGGGGGGGGDEMTVFHFLNCAALTFGPHVVYYSATPLSEYDTIGTCVKAAVVYLGTALVKLVCLATLLKVPENDSFDPYQELMKIFIGFIDVAGLYFALTQLTHRNISQNHKFQAVGLGWAFADSVLHRLAPLWIGARGLEFTWEYIFQGLEANANLVMTLSLAALGSLMWLRKNKPRTLLLEEIIRVADSKGGWLRAVLLTGHGFHQLAAVLSLSETNVRNEFANCRRFMQIAGDSRS
uniref:BOS complex subunit TMEM147 n=1 Tax=Oryza meridionalis TaxID=40149 RepID=A0A0E0D7D2_9ORYZ